jgi:TatD DNase family protein
MGRSPPVSLALLDSHCHLDAIPGGLNHASWLESAQIFTVAVTNSPYAFKSQRALFAGFKWVKLALGCHPLLQADVAQTLAEFRRQLPFAPYVGEIGLDFSRDGWETRNSQVELLRQILRALVGHSKFITLHSRQAESALLDLLEEVRPGPVAFHWYTGSTGNLDRLLKAGHYCSINSPMANASKGRKLLARIPRQSVLTETDSPYGKNGRRTVMPGDVSHVVKVLAGIWHVSPTECAQIIRENFKRLLSQSSSDTSPV